MRMHAAKMAGVIAEVLNEDAIPVRLFPKRIRCSVVQKQANRNAFVIAPKTTYALDPLLLPSGIGGVRQRVIDQSNGGVPRASSVMLRLWDILTGFRRRHKAM